MLSGRLIHLIETHSDSIIDRVIHQIRNDPEIPQIGRLPEAELRQWGRLFLEKLGEWLAGGKDEELGRRYEVIGRIRFEEAIPLHESVHALFLLKGKMIQFVQDQAEARTAMQLYAEEELEHRVDRFFDIMVCHLVRGYESALRRASHAGVGV